MTMNYIAIPGLRNTKKINADKVIDIVAMYFRTDAASIKKKNRKRELVTARHFCFFFLRKNTNLSLKTIGEQFTQDHTTVINGVQKIQGFLDIEDQETVNNYHEINAMLNS